MIGSKLGYIDSLRGVAIILVVIVHVGDVLVNMSRGIHMFSDYGQFGVQLFFIVSAFTLCLTMDKRGNEENALAKFYIRRYFRIAPLYYIGILLYLCYYTFRPIYSGNAPELASWYTLKNVAVNILFIRDFFPGAANNSVVPGGWSIGTEMTFYILFPLLLFLYKRFRNNNAALILLPIIGLFFSFICIHILNYAFIHRGKTNLWNYLVDEGFLYFNIICQLPAFFMGMSLYFVLQKHQSVKKSLLYISIIGFIIISIIVTFLLYYFETLVYLLPFTAGLAFVFLFLLFKEIPLLDNRILRRIGELSYSIYLFHFVFAWDITELMYKRFHSIISSDLLLIIGTCTSLMITVFIAIIAEKYVEKPGIEMGKKIIEKVKAKNLKAF